ncbi:MAG: signal peptide peptidase SppA [Alistipes sp.]|nr:signal peptide peptidase SppA [Alistipes sp.]
MKFLKAFLAALLAVVVGGFLSTFIWIMVLAGMAGSMESPVVVEENSILKIDFMEQITDSPSTDPLAGFDFQSLEMTPSLSLYKVLQAIDAARNDERIKGIYIRPIAMDAISGAAMEELRAALVEFKQSGKFILAYSEVYTQGSYYIASVADKIYLQKEGAISWQGLSSTTPFFKGLFDKLDIEYEIFRPTVCKYKSAVEPYFLKRMSPENREQMQQVVNSMWSVVAGDVAASRGFESVEELNRLTDRLALCLPEDALKNGMVDGLIYEDEMEPIFAEQGVERNADQEFNFITLGDYAAQLIPDVEHITDPAITILYADGAIVDGEGTVQGEIYGNTLASQIAELRKDEEVKAVVVRVNSPGGSALASDVIWREMSLLRDEKPVIISMGNYAASGGYYISAPADVILADRLTLTGSIGVFGAFPVMGEMAEKQLGITFDGVKSNSSADFGEGFLMGSIRPATPAQRAYLIRSVDKVYESFTTKVSSGRNLPIEQVLEIAGGRVWTGVDALQIGLVDGHGGLKAAIGVAAEKAGLSDYRVEEYMPEMEGFAALLSGLNVRLKAQHELDALGEALLPYKKAREVLKQQGVLMYMPYEITLF